MPPSSEASNRRRHCTWTQIRCGLSRPLWAVPGLFGPLCLDLSGSSWGPRWPSEPLRVNRWGLSGAAGRVWASKGCLLVSLSRLRAWGLSCPVFHCLGRICTSAASEARCSAVFRSLVKHSTSKMRLFLIVFVFFCFFLVVLNCSFVFLGFSLFFLGLS